MMELTNLEIMGLRNQLYAEVNNLPHLKQNGWHPESKDIESIKTQIIAKIAYKIWEKHGKPKNNDIAIWLEAENIWNYIRYAWF